MNINTVYTKNIISQQTYDEIEKKYAHAINEVENGTFKSDMLGWVDPKEHCTSKLIDDIQNIANEIRENADVFVVIGIGGSNQGARALIDAIGATPNSPEIIYAALNLSAREYKKILEKINSKSVYINVIAKNFKTLEPGLTFRLFRQYMAQRYKESAPQRIIVTPTIGDEALHKICLEQNYRHVPFAENVGGRFSVFTAVGLLPCAVAGLNIQQLVSGAKYAFESFKGGTEIRKFAKEYAILRKACLDSNINLEVFAFFEPQLEYLARWWRQLFGESEGKNSTGLFPTTASYTEDLHSIGQYMQQGRRQMLETFIIVNSLKDDVTIPSETLLNDGFDYLDGKTLNFVNDSAFKATLKAHSSDNVPCIVIEIDELNEYNLAQLMYFFFISCFYSAVILGVNPFDQPGVENYKSEMMNILGAK